MTLSWSAAAGGVTGKDHRRTGRDGQDGLGTVRTDAVSAAIVTDGCSSGRASEVGARLGAACLADLVRCAFDAEDGSALPELEGAASAITRGLIARLEATARIVSGAGPIDAGFVGEHLLFGFLVAAVANGRAIVFGVGDGFAWVDGKATVIDPGPENAPVYAAYALLGTSIVPRVHHLGPASEVDTIVVGTDGAEELLVSAVDTDEPPLGALVRDDRLLVNPSLLRKRLLVLSQRGMFHDDATLGVVRRAR